VDHVFPWATLGEVYFYRNLFQSLCGACHSAKTQLEQKGTVRHYTTTGAKDYTMNDALFIINEYA